MTILGNERKLADLNKNCAEHPTSFLAQNSNVPRSPDDYITQISEEIEGRLTKKLSQGFRTESCILGALSQPDEFLLNPLIQGHSEDAGTHLVRARERMRTTPRVIFILKRVSLGQTTRNSGPDDIYNAAIFSVRRRYFSGSTPLFFWLNAAVSG